MLGPLSNLLKCCQAEWWIISLQGLYWNNPTPYYFSNLSIRYSKVLEANLGNVYSVGALPACLVLKTLIPYPTNTTQPESLAQVIVEGALNLRSLNLKNLNLNSLNLKFEL